MTMESTNPSSSADIRSILASGIGKGNYTEIVFFDGIDDINIPYDIFYKALIGYKSNVSYPCFQRHCKEYVYRNLFYENNDKSQIKVYRKNLTNRLTLTAGTSPVNVLIFHKEKLPFHAFPSTQNLHSVAYVTKATFKISNRVYVNFERKKYDNCQGNDICNKVYINYNHECNVDTASVAKTLTDVVGMLATLL
jgi:hypothetical protein